MAELIHQSSSRVVSEGTTYRAVVMGERNPDGQWHGWIEFQPENGDPPLATGRETSQQSRSALEYWATGLEPTYYEGAFDRSRPELEPRP